MRCYTKTKEVLYYEEMIGYCINLDSYYLINLHSSFATVPDFIIVDYSHEIELIEKTSLHSGCYYNQLNLISKKF